VEERRYDRRATPAKHDPRNHPIGAGLGRINVHPERVGDYRRRKREDEEHPAHALFGLSEECAGRADDHEQIGDEQGQDSER
jgi:hypothetical protein